MANDLASTDMQQRQVAVVVVHGVGDAVPAAALNDLVSKLEINFEGQFKADSHSEVHQLASPSIIPGDPVDTFPAHTRNATLTATGDRIRFYDLHWADLTKTLPGRLNAFLGAFRIIFEAHHFIDALLPRESGGVARLLRTSPIVGRLDIAWPNCWSEYIPCGNWLGILCWLALPSPDPWRRPPGRWVDVVRHRSFGGNFRHRHRRSSAIVAIRARPEWNDVLVTIIYGSVLVGGVYSIQSISALGITRSVSLQTFRRCDSIEFIYSIIQIFRVTWCWLLLLAIPLVAWLYLSSLFKQTAVRPSAGMAALSVVVLQSALWLALISAFAIPLIKEAALRHELAERPGRVECD